MKLVSLRAAWKKGFLDFVTTEQPDVLTLILD